MIRIIIKFIIKTLINKYLINTCYAHGRVVKADTPVI